MTGTDAEHHRNTPGEREAVTVMVVDDHPIWRDGVARDLAERETVENRLSTAQAAFCPSSRLSDRVTLANPASFRLSAWWLTIRCVLRFIIDISKSMKPMRAILSMPKRARLDRILLEMRRFVNADIAHP